LPTVQYPRLIVGVLYIDPAKTKKHTHGGYNTSPAKSFIMKILVHWSYEYRNFNIPLGWTTPHFIKPLHLALLLLKI
jgi:hypothetical protein